MSKGLVPKLVAEMAENVYLLTRTASAEKAHKELNRIYGGSLKFSDENLLKGKTGLPGPISVKTAFGFVLVGQNSFQHSFLLFRGTQYLADWLTNLNIMTESSESGAKVHSGFQQAFNSMLPKLKDLIKGIPQNHEVHCIGHSLGGAIAGIAAEWMRKNTTFKPKLYTFGAPRVGLESFASNLERLLKIENIYRAYHKTDIVPCIPVWPFIHAPMKGQDYFLPSPGFLPGPDWHDMSKYVDSVSGKTWKHLSALRPPARSVEEIKRWLSSTARATFSMESIGWIHSAIVFVVEQCMKVVGKALNLAVNTSFTLLDTLAYMLEQAIRIDEHVSKWVIYLMRKIADFLGLVKAWKDEDFSKAVIRDLFTRMQVRVNELAKTALSQALANGRALQ